MSAQTKSIHKGQVLIHQGEDSTNMYLLQEGLLRVSLNKVGKKVELGIIYPGEMVGEMSFLDQEPRCATVEAIEDSVLLEIPRDKFDDMLANLPPWFQSLQRTLLDRLRRANKYKI